MLYKIFVITADQLQSLADGFVACLEVILSDHGGKRPRRSHRIITRRVYRRYAPRPIHYHIHNQRLIVRRDA